MTITRFLGAIALSLYSLALAPTAALSAEFPDKPIRIVVAYPPGGANDFLARVLAENLGKRWHQPVIVENRPGAGGVVGTHYVARSDPDGYTLMLGGITNAILPSVYPDLPFDAVKDFSEIGMMASGPLVVVVHPSLKVANLKELIDYARANPGKISYGSAGSGTSVHVVVEMFKQMANIDMVHIPYKGSGPAMLGLIAGETQLMMDVIPSALPQIQGGRIKPLAVSGSKRASALPEVPTAAESGWPDFDISIWWGVMGPAGIPENVRQKLNEGINAALKDPEVAAKIASRGLEPTSMSSDEFTRVFAKDVERFGKTVRQANIRAE